jgi:hypothetical protein
MGVSKDLNFSDLAAIIIAGKNNIPVDQVTTDYANRRQAEIRNEIAQEKARNPDKFLP